jgi:hypothetical protein
MPRLTMLTVIASLVLTGCTATSNPIEREGETPATPPAPRPISHDDAEDTEDADDSEAALFRALDETFGRAGEIKAGVYCRP